MDNSTFRHGKVKLKKKKCSIVVHYYKTCESNCKPICFTTSLESLKNTDPLYHVFTLQCNVRM